MRGKIFQIIGKNIKSLNIPSFPQKIITIKFVVYYFRIQTHLYLFIYLSIWMYTQTHTYFFTQCDYTIQTTMPYPLIFFT